MIDGALIEDTLFGHIKGAFTNAMSDYKGLFEEADGGILFLDELAEMPMASQSKLLRVLEDKEIRRLGSNKTIKVDVRFISGTNKDPKKAIDEKKLREDLYYRVSTITINLPPLRERKEDILHLARHFLGNANIKNEKHIVDISPEVRKVFVNYSWPGNVRELENVIEQAVALTQNDVIHLNDLPEGFASGVGKEVSLEEDPKKTIERAIESTKGNLTLAARNLGISRTTIWRRMKEYKISHLKDKHQDE
jgi:two-component system response regulator HydG